jgi:hypothetical protein
MESSPCSGWAVQMRESGGEGEWWVRLVGERKGMRKGMRASGWCGGLGLGAWRGGRHVRVGARGVGLGRWVYNTVAHHIYVPHCYLRQQWRTYMHIYVVRHC